MTPISILQLEDSTLDAELALALLSKAGLNCKVERVETRDQFIRALEAKEFDLILADYMLPDFDGVSALQLVREKSHYLPFIFVSGVLGEEIAIDTLKRGATDYVLKRRMDRLVPAVKRALAESQERRSRQRAEQVLQETEDRFRNMADSAPVLIWTCGPDTLVDYVNRTLTQFTGRQEAKELGEGWIEQVHPDDADSYYADFSSAFEERRTLNREYRLRRHDGEYRWLLETAVPRFDGAGQFLGYIGSCLDVTELKRTEERLRHAAKLESLGILAGGIAHDFNNILTGIMGNASLLQGEVEPDSMAAELVESVIQASERAAQLTRQMLAYSGKGRFVIRALHVSEQIREIVPLLDAALPKNISVELHLHPNLPLVQADPGQFQQLIMNLVINGGEAAGPEGGEVIITTGVEDWQIPKILRTGEVLPAGKYVLIEVRDNGQGMDQDTLSRIFDPFFTTKFTGRGLGLAAVSGIVRGHKGMIEVDTAVGKGTAFHVYLPASDSVDLSPKPLIQAFKYRDEGYILVIDDEDVVRKTAKIALQSFGFTVHLASNGKEGLDIFQSCKNPIRLVLLDMTMPIMSGDETLKRLLELDPNLRIIATSGYDETEAMRRFGEGVAGFIQKPYTATQLANVVESVLQKPDHTIQ